MGKVCMGHVTSADVDVIDYLACVVCGNPTMPVSSSGPQRKTCDVVCRVELFRRNHQPVAAAIARRPMVKIGTRSLKTLRSDTYRGTRNLRTSAVMTVSENTPARVKDPAWPGHKARCKRI